MRIHEIYSKRHESVILDVDVEVTIAHIRDMSTNVFRLICEVLFDKPMNYNSRAVQNLLTDLPEIQDYVTWADAQIDAAREAFLSVHADDYDDVADAIAAWWDRYTFSDDWPSWERYLE